MKKNRIVSILVASALLTLSVAATSFAAKGDKEVDLGVGFDTESVSGSGSGWGFSVGGGLELLDIAVVKGSTLQVRGDIGYNRWKKDIVTLTRIPISGGARLYVPIEGMKNLRVYGEAGLELSIDKSEVDIPFFGKHSASENHFGVYPAAGVEFTVTPNIFVSAALKYHIVDSGYLNAGVGVGYKF